MEALINWNGTIDYVAPEGYKNDIWNYKTFNRKIRFHVPSLDEAVSATCRSLMSGPS